VHTCTFDDCGDSGVCFTMEFIECAKGGKKLLLNGFMYTKKAVKKNRIRWECSQRAAHDCKGAVTTSHQVRMQSHSLYYTETEQTSHIRCVVSLL